MEDISLVAFVDLDGTLLNDKKEISNYNKKVLKTFKLKEHHLVPCSGRYSSFILNKIKNTACSDYIISDNGALVYNHLTKEKIQAKAINKEDLKDLLHFSDQNKIGVVLNCFEERFKNIHCANQEITELFEINSLDKDIYQAVFITKDYALALKLEELINENNNLEINYKSLNLLTKTRNLTTFVYDVNLKGVCKGDGIKALLKHLNISKDKTIAIGDHYNDISMFQEAGIKVAMHNAYEILREKADLITETNENNGVAKILLAIMDSLEEKN